MLQRNDGPFIVCLNGYLRMAKPHNVSDGELGAAVVFVISFLKDHVRKHVPALQASNH